MKKQKSENKITIYHLWASILGTGIIMQIFLGIHSPINTAVIILGVLFVGTLFTYFFKGKSLSMIIILLILIIEVLLMMCLR